MTLRAEATYQCLAPDMTYVYLVLSCQDDQSDLCCGGWRKGKARRGTIDVLRPKKGSPAKSIKVQADGRSCSGQFNAPDFDLHLHQS